MFTQALTPKYFKILFCILDIRLLVLKQDWAELCQGQPSPHETTNCLINRNINISNHEVAQKEVKDLSIPKQLFTQTEKIFYKSFYSIL